MTNDTFTELSDDQLRRAIRDIAAWAEPSVVSDPSERPPVALVPLDRVGRRRWSQPAVRVAAAAAAVAIVVAAAVFAVDRSDPPVADDPPLQGVIDRLPDGLTTLDMVDLEALRAVESPTDKVSATLEAAPYWVRGLIELPDVELDVDVDSVTVLAQSSNAPRDLVYDPSRGSGPRRVSIVATSEDPSALGAALLDVGFEEIGEGRYQLAPRPDEVFLLDSMVARVEPGYLTVVATNAQGPTGLDLFPAPAGPSAGLAAVLEAGTGFYLFSASVDDSVPDLGCGAAEAVVHGPEGYRLLALTGADGTVRDEFDEDLLGFGAAGQQSRDGDLATVVIEPAPWLIAGPYPYGLFGGDRGSFIDC